MNAHVYMDGWYTVVVAALKPIRSAIHNFENTLLGFIRHIVKYSQTHPSVHPWLLPRYPQESPPPKVNTNLPVLSIVHRLSWGAGLKEKGLIAQGLSKRGPSLKNPKTL